MLVFQPLIDAITFVADLFIGLADIWPFTLLGGATAGPGGEVGGAGAFAKAFGGEDGIEVKSPVITSTERETRIIKKSSKKTASGMGQLLSAVTKILKFTSGFSLISSAIKALTGDIDKDAKNRDQTKADKEAQNFQNRKNVVQKVQQVVNDDNLIDAIMKEWDREILLQDSETQDEPLGVFALGFA